MRYGKLFFILVLHALFCAAAFADVVSLSASKDNTLYQDTNPSSQLSDGQGVYLYAGKTGSNDSFQVRRGLIAFDLRSIPPNASITAATLTLFKSNSNTSATISLHKLTRDWGEGASNAGDPGGSGAPAQAGDATWLYNFYNTGAWTVAGGDFLGAQSAATVVTSNNAAYSWSGSGVVADVQSWVTNPGSNFGWAILGDEVNATSAQRFNSRQNSSNPPLLTITFQIAGPTPTPTPSPTPGPTSTPTSTPGPIAAVIPHGPLRVNLQTIATGLVSPDLLISAPDGANRLFVLEQTGQIRLIKKGILLSTPFLDVTTLLAPLVSSYDERGLLGLAFDPGFNNSASPGYRRIFTYTSQPVSGPADLPDPYATSLNCQNVVASWRVSASNPDLVDPNSRQEILRIDKPQSNHNGGMIAFGPDGYLYIGTGDGGGANDNNLNGHNPSIGNGQDVTIGLGKILRIDVNGTNSANGRYGIPSDNPFASSGGLKEIFAWGFRNPYRFSFNGVDLLVADVGQNNIEEVDRVEKGKNYGWRYKEGTFKFNPADGTVSSDLSGLPPGLTDPIAEYDHDEGISIIGGFVYRGALLPELQGKYVFGDFSTSFSTPAGRLFYLDLATGEIRALILGKDDHPLGLFVKGMGQDQNGEIYVLGSSTLGPTGTTGVVLQLVPVPSQLQNISTRGRVQTGENVMIGGFIVTGNQSKTVILRGMGPSLQQFGVSDFLPDPVLELHAADGSLINSNDNWKIDDKTQQSQETTIRATGIPPSNDLESAIVTTLNPGAYTAILSGKSGSIGVGLVEAYDLDTGGAQLGNLSTRDLVQLDTNVMIGGFIVGGGSPSASSKVVVRALGPTLAQFGIANPLADPTLELHDSNGTLIRADDNWQDDSTQAAAISAANLAPTNSLESAIIATLPPGGYTAIVAGKNRSTGVGLVEAYRLP
jgi:glucose/arabinose dehydrogenase